MDTVMARKLAMMRQVNSGQVAWTTGSHSGVCRIRALIYSSPCAVRDQDYVSLERIEGRRPPAVLIGAILDEALGPDWAGDSPQSGEVRVNTHPGGRVSVRCRGVRSAMRISPQGGVEDFLLPSQLLAEMVAHLTVPPEKEPWAKVARID